MFTLGLVHDVGRTLIASAMHNGGSLATHGQLGAYLLAVWGFPLSIIEAVACHDNATAPSTPLAIALRAAHA
jgi:HD-like signal output (HDOD) protein